MLAAVVFDCATEEADLLSCNFEDYSAEVGVAKEDDFGAGEIVASGGRMTWRKGRHFVGGGWGRYIRESRKCYEY